MADSDDEMAVCAAWPLVLILGNVRTWIWRSRTPGDVSAKTGDIQTGCIMAAR